MDIIEFLSSRGYLFQSDEPGFFLRCADATLQYRTWNPAIRSAPFETKAPFGLIYAKGNGEKGAELFYNQLRKNWEDFSCHPEALVLCTSKCNLNCPYCIIGVQEGAKFGFPSIEQIEKALRLFPVKRVEITGGEPLAQRDDLEEILEWLIGKVERCDLVTNGLAVDDRLWPLLQRCGKKMDLRMRVTLSEGLSHMRLTEFEGKILPKAVDNPEVKINLSFLPNHDGSGMAGFFKRMNQLALPAHITVSPLCLLESKFSGSVAFNVENYIKEMLEVIENQAEYLSKVNFFSEPNFGPLVHEPQLAGCKRGKIALSDQGYGLCHMTLRDGNFLAGPLETALFSWGRFSKHCQECQYYPDQCLEAIKSERCFHLGQGCYRCPIVYSCLLRCPYIFNAKGNTDDDTDLQCLTHSLLQIFTMWLLHRNRSWQEIQKELAGMQTIND